MKITSTLYSWIPAAVRALSFVIVAYFCGSSVFAAESGRCERLFKEPTAIATCNTISNMSGSNLSDDELRETVSRTVYGLSADQVEKEVARREADRRKAESEAEAALIKTDQCYRLFATPLERETCRALRMLTYRQRTDDEMRDAVKERLDSIRMDEEKQRKAAIEAEERHKRAAIEEEIRRKTEQEQRKKAATETERRRKDAERALDTQLKKGAIGFALGGWERSGFGTVMIIHFTLQNNTNASKKDFIVECDTRANSGTVLSTPRTTLYEQLEPGA